MGAMAWYPNVASADSADSLKIPLKYILGHLKIHEVNHGQPW